MSCSERPAAIKQAGQVHPGSPPPRAPDNLHRGHRFPGHMARQPACVTGPRQGARSSSSRQRFSLMRHSMQTGITWRPGHPPCRIAARVSSSSCRSGGQPGICPSTLTKWCTGCGGKVSHSAPRLTVDRVHGLAALTLDHGIDTAGQGAGTDGHQQIGAVRRMASSRSDFGGRGQASLPPAQYRPRRSCHRQKRPAGNL